MIIGTMIKKLRRERDITQEQLAEYLNISSQAVSQWECGRNAPDISQLPLLANIFEVSADVLLGIDADSKQHKIDVIFENAKKVSYTGAKDKAIDILLSGLKEYPDSYKLMVLYSSEIYIRYAVNSGESEAIRKEKGLEVAAYLDKIIAGCTENYIRGEAVALACRLFPRIGRYDDAINLAKSMPEYTGRELLECIYMGTKKYEQLRDIIFGNFVHSIGETYELVKSKYDDGHSVYTRDEQLEIHLKTIQMFKLFFEKDDYFYHAQYAEAAHTHAADIYAEYNDRENTMYHLEQAVKFAVIFDTYDAKAIHTSLLVKGSEAGGIWWEDSSNRTHALLSELSADTGFDFIRETPQYIALINELKKHAKE